MTNEKLPRRIRTQQLKEKIIRAAIDLIRVQGYESVTINDICKATDIAVGSFYHLFPSKDRLLSYVLVDVFEKNMEAFQQIGSGDVIEDICACYRLYNRFLMDEGLDFVQNYYTTKNKSLFTMGSEHGRNVSAPIIEKISELLIRSFEEGMLQKKPNISEICGDLATIEKGVIFDWCLCDGSYDLIARADLVIRRYLQGIIVV